MRADPRFKPLPDEPATLISEGKVRSFVHEEVPLEEVSRAHELMESGSHSGKILLTISE